MGHAAPEPAGLTEGCVQEQGDDQDHAQGSSAGRGDSQVVLRFGPAIAAFSLRSIPAARRLNRKLSDSIYSPTCRVYIGVIPLWQLDFSKARSTI
jgi:hypothetical protein